MKAKTTERQPKAKTAYELLEQVIAHIKEEPKRYAQATWGARNSDAIKAVGPATVPPCGTIACRAGWIVALNDGLPAFTARIRHDSIERRANDILGFKRQCFCGNPSCNGDSDGALETRELFAPHAAGNRGFSVREHARRGVAGLRAFMKQHKAHLQNRKLRGV